MAQVTVVQALATPYGWTLAVKIGMVALLLLAATANLVWVRPRLRSGGRAAYWLRRLVAVECVLAVLVIMSVGLLTAFEPARQVASREGADVGDQRLTFQESDEGADMRLRIIPGQVGLNKIEVSIRDRFGEPITNATDIRVRLSYLDADLGETPLSATHTGGGEYLLEGQLIGLAGAWQSELVVQRPDAFDARAAFRFEVSGGGGSLAIAPTAEVGRTLLGIELGVLGLVLLAIGVPMGGWYSRAGRLTMAPGVLGVLVGAALLFNSLGSDSRTIEREPDPAVLRVREGGPRALSNPLSAVSWRDRTGRRPVGVDYESAARGPGRPCPAPSGPCAVRVRPGRDTGYRDARAEGYTVGRGDMAHYQLHPDSGVRCRG